MSKKKLISIHQSHKSGKSNDTSNQRVSNTPIQLKTSVKSKSKSKVKNDGSLKIGMPAEMWIKY